tara:strand:- start:107 stop:301 length:195 start_codon:yes stop_codon:yes gene_type:complete
LGKFPEIAKEWHPTKNGDLTPDKVTYGSNKKVWWQCPKNIDHVWNSLIKDRTRIGIRKRNCPDC